MSNDDGSTVGGVAVFRIDPANGVAIQLAGASGCITGDGTTGGAPGTCANGRALGYGYGMSVSPDGTSVYQATDAYDGAGLAIYHRKAPKPVLSGLHVSGHTGSLKDQVQAQRQCPRDLHVQRSGHRVSGRLVESGKAGANRFRFNGKVGGHSLGVGKYQVTATPVRGKAKKTRFTLKH